MREDGWSSDNKMEMRQKRQVKEGEEEVKSDQRPLMELQISWSKTRRRRDLNTANRVDLRTVHIYRHVTLI